MKIKPKNDWLEALEAVANAKLEKPGPEWKNRAQIGEMLGVKESSARRRVAELLKAGKAEKKLFTMVNSGGGKTPVPHYRLIK